MDEIEKVKREMVNLYGEMFALQAILISVLKAASDADDGTRILVAKAFDNAADFAENFSIAHGTASHHIPHALQSIEQFRIAICGPAKPKHGV